MVNKTIKGKKQFTKSLNFYTSFVEECKKFEWENKISSSCNFWFWKKISYILMNLCP